MDLQNQKLNRKTTDIRTKLDQVLKMLPNLSQLFATGDDETKKTIMCSIFAQKLEFQETAFRTPQINSALSSILLINNQLQNKKKEKSLIKVIFPAK